MLYHAGAASIQWLRGKTNIEQPRLCEVQRSERGYTIQALERSRKSVATGQLAGSKFQRDGPSAEQMDLGVGWNQVVLEGVSSKLPRLEPPTHIIFPSSAGQGGARDAYRDR